MLCTTMRKENGDVICKSSHHKILKSIVILTGLNFVILMLGGICFSWWIIQNYHSKTEGIVSDVNTITTVIPTTTWTKTTNSSTFHIITRNEWQAQRPKTNLTELQSPVDRVIIYQIATEMCSNRISCADLVRKIQRSHIETNKWDDIGANFLIGGDGAAYEGRGWNNQGAHTKRYNAGSIGISMIGTFKVNSPPQIQFEALKLLLAKGVRLNKLTDDYRMYPHRAYYNSENPSMAVINGIKDWPHYFASLK